MCRFWFCWLWMDLIGSCVDSVDSGRFWLAQVSTPATEVVTYWLMLTLWTVTNPDWLMFRLCRLWSTPIGSWANQGQSQLTATTHEPIRVIHCRQKRHKRQSGHSRQLSRSGLITVDRVDTWANQCQSQTTESTHESISVDHLRQSRDMGESMTINLDRVEIWTLQGQSQSTDSKHELIKVI